jgi:hypothetical protein
MMTRLRRRRTRSPWQKANTGTQQVDPDWDASERRYTILGVEIVFSQQPRIQGMIRMFETGLACFGDATLCSNSSECFTFLFRQNFCKPGLELAMPISISALHILCYWSQYSGDLLQHRSTSSTWVAMFFLPQWNPFLSIRGIFATPTLKRYRLPDLRESLPTGSHWGLPSVDL